MFGSKKKSMMTPPSSRMGCGAWVVLAFGVLVVTLLVYDWITGIDWDQTSANFWETALAPLTIAATIIVGAPLTVAGVWASVLDTPRAVENDSERRWIVTTAGWAAWTLAALLAAFWAAPAGLLTGVGLWAVLVTRRGCAKRQKPVTIRDGLGAVLRLIRRYWVVTSVVVLAATAAWLVVDHEATPYTDEVRLSAGASVMFVSVAVALLIRPDVRRTADLRALKSVIARHVLGIPDGRLGDLGWRVRGGPKPRLELGFKGVGAPVRGTGLADEMWAEVDRRLSAHAPSLQCASLTDVGITLVKVSADTEARRMLAEQTQGLVVAVESVDQSEPVAVAATNVGENDD